MIQIVYFSHTGLLGSEEPASTPFSSGVAMECNSGTISGMISEDDLIGSLFRMLSIGDPRVFSCDLGKDPIAIAISYNVKT